MKPFVRYTLLRFLLFAAVALGLWAIGARGVLFIVLAILISAALAYVLLRGPRDDVAERLAGRIEDRIDRRAAEDNAAEDADAER